MLRRAGPNLATYHGLSLMEKNIPLREITNFKDFQYQVQGFENRKWVLVSCHIKESTANKMIFQYRRCRPDRAFRLVHATDTDNFIMSQPNTSAN